MYNSELKSCLHRLSDARPTLRAIHNIYHADADLPNWLWNLATKQDPEALLRTTIKHKRLIDAGRIATILFENALQAESPLGPYAFQCCLPWSHLDKVIAAYSEFVKNAPKDCPDGEVFDIHSRLNGLCSRYSKHTAIVHQHLRSFAL